MVEQPKPVPPIVYGGDVGTAPVIFFDGAPATGGFNGLVAITLTAILHSPQNDGKVQVENRVVAHLRTNVEGIKSLRSAIDGALLMLKPVEGQTN